MSELRAAERPASDELRAGLFMVTGAALFAVHFAIIKHLTADLPEPVIALWRSVFAVMFYMPRVARGGWLILRTAHPAGHAWRSFFGFASFLIFVYALALLPLGDTVALTFSSPFWSVILGVLVFRDRITPRLIMALVVGFTGVILIAQPTGGTGLSLGAMLALISAVLTSLAMMMVKQLARSEPPERIAFYFALGGGVFALPISFFYWAWPALYDWPYLVAAGGMFLLGQHCLSTAYSLGTFSRVAPLDLARLPVSVIVGMLWFAEMPTVVALGGMALIVLASLDILLQSRKKPA